jgi:hypothetical protein
VNDKERNLVCSLAAEIRAGGFSDEITINIAGDQVVAVFEIVRKDQAYVSNWQALWAQATPADVDSLIKQNFLQTHPKGDGRYWLDTKRMLAECE